MGTIGMYVHSSKTVDTLLEVRLVYNCNSCEKVSHCSLHVPNDPVVGTRT